MTSFRASLALRIGVGTLLVFIAMGTVSVLALRSILSEQLDGTLLHLAEVEAQAGAATTGSNFEFHEGVLLGSSKGPATELTRYAQLWTSEGRPLVRSRNLSAHLELPQDALSRAKAGAVGWATHDWRGESIRSVVYPLSLVGAAHGVHLLQVAAPTAPINQTLSRFTWLVAGLTVIAGGAAYYMGWRNAGLALRPTREITQQTEAIEAGTLSDRITAHADVEEFRRLVTVFNSMLDRLDDAFKVQRQFTADAGHELRAPLTVLRGDLDVTLKRERTAAEYRETLERCREEVLRLSRLAEDLLVLARTDAGVLLEHRTEVDLRSLAEHAVERYRPLAAQRDITLEIVGEGVVLADPRVLGRVIGNLIDNAVKFSPNGGTVRMEIASSDVVRLVVSDEGQGISPEHVGHLFRRFFRADPARPRADGTGLGLAIARAGAQAHGGNVEFVGNSPGATFALILPALPQGQLAHSSPAPMTQSRSEPATR